MGRKRKTNQQKLEELWAKVHVNTETGCWEYGPSCVRPHTAHDGVMIPTEKLVWMILKGDVPKGTRPTRTCDAFNCINPDHRTYDKYVPAALKDRHKTDEEYVAEFVSKIQVNAVTNCWNWTGSVKLGKYPTFKYRYKDHGAHIMAWRMWKGREVGGANELRKTCDSPLCINPDHRDEVPRGTSPWFKRELQRAEMHTVLHEQREEAAAKSQAEWDGMLEKLRTAAYGDSQNPPSAPPEAQKSDSAASSPHTPSVSDGL